MELQKGKRNAVRAENINLDAQPPTVHRSPLDPLPSPPPRGSVTGVWRSGKSNREGEEEEEEMEEKVVTAAT